MWIISVVHESDGEDKTRVEQRKAMSDRELDDFNNYSPRVLVGEAAKDCFLGVREHLRLQSGGKS